MERWGKLNITIRHLKTILQAWRPEQCYLQSIGHGVAIPGQFGSPKYSQARLVTSELTPVDFQSELQPSKFSRSGSDYSHQTVNEILEAHKSQIQRLVQQLLSKNGPVIVHDARGEVYLLYRQFWNRTGVLDVKWMTTSGLAHWTTKVLRGRSSNMPTVIAWNLARLAADTNGGWGITGS